MIQDKQIHIKFKEYDSAAELPEQLRILLEHAHESRLHAYAPYSGFLVGASVLLEDGKMISGNNQENASFPVGICAERVTLSSAAAQNPDKKMIALAITAGGKNNPTNNPVMPCGICRQTMLEYEHRFNHNLQIVLQGNEGKIFVFETARELLPLSFNASDFAHLKL